MKLLTATTLLLAAVVAKAENKTKAENKGKCVVARDIIAGPNGKYYVPTCGGVLKERVLIPRNGTGHGNGHERVLKKKTTDQNRRHLEAETVLPANGATFDVGSIIDFEFKGLSEGTLEVSLDGGDITRTIDISENYVTESEDSDTIAIKMMPLPRHGADEAHYTWSVAEAGLSGTFTIPGTKVSGTTKSSNARTAAGPIRQSGTTTDADTTFVDEAAWEGEGLVQYAVGRIYFESYGVDYACTGTVVKDNKTGRSLVFTAAHCVWDDIDGVFGTNVIFIPNRDAVHDLVGFVDDYHRRCDEDPCGCWTLSGGVVHDLWPDTPWPQRLRYDYGFYVVDDVGSHQGADCGSDALDIAVEPMEFAVGEETKSVFMTNFGYSLSFNPDFRYCAEETMTKQPTPGLDTIWMDTCGLSGGASGGPWMTEFDTKTGKGKVVSTNSWSYSTRAGMGAPFIDESEARCLINAARDADMEWMMSQPVGEQGIYVSCYERPCIDDEDTVRKLRGHRELCSTTIVKKSKP